MPTPHASPDPVLLSPESDLLSAVPCPPPESHAEQESDGSDTASASESPADRASLDFDTCTESGAAIADMPRELDGSDTARESESAADSPLSQAAGVAHSHATSIDVAWNNNQRVSEEAAQVPAQVKKLPETQLRNTWISQVAPHGLLKYWRHWICKY